MRTYLVAIFLVIFTPLTVLGVLLGRVISRGCSSGVRRLWARGILFSAGLPCRIRGRENIETRGPYVVVANHASMLDIPICASALPLSLLFVSRPFFFKVPFLGWGMSLLSDVRLDPKKPRQAARVLRTLHTRFDLGLSLLLFPEGTRSPDGKVKRYKRGPFLTAIENQVPILPVCIEGVHEALPKRTLRVRPRTLGFTIGKPIPTEGLKRPDARALAQRVEDWTRSVQSVPDTGLTQSVSGTD
ncbi:MAG: lysophospholipid acyltransferase family protein [Planctomycetota bacterium]